MSLKVAIDNLKFDVRMADINIKNQHITQEELKKHQEKLPDLKAQALQVDLDNQRNDDLNGHDD